MTTEELGQACMDARPMVFAALRTFRTLDREDVFQDACLRALGSRAKYDGRSQFSTWFVRVAINCALMQLRTDRRHHPTAAVSELPVYESDVIEFKRTPRAPDALKGMISEEELDAVLVVLSALPRCYRNVIDAHILRELSYDEAAAELHISRGCVKSCYSRGRKRIRKLLHA